VSTGLHNTLQESPSDGHLAAPPPPLESAAIELPEIIYALRRRWWLIVLVTMVGAGIFYLASSRQAKVYSASAKVILEAQLPKVLGTDLEMNASRNAEAGFSNTQFEVMQSRAVIRGAIAQLKLADDPAYLDSYNIRSDGEARIKSIEDIIRARLDVVPGKQSSIVNIEVEDFDPARAARIANTVAQVYIDQSLESRLSDTHFAAKWLDERVGEFGKRLDESERTLDEFKREKMLLSVSLEDRKNMTSSRLGSLNDKLNIVRGQLIQLEAERDTLRKVTHDRTPGMEALSAPRVARSSVVATLMAAKVSLEQEAAKQSARYGEKHPNMEALNSQIRGLQASLMDEIARIVATLDNEITELQTAEQRLTAEVASETQRAMEINTVALDYNKLNRDVGTNQNTYSALLKRQTEADLSGLLKSNFVRWLETAEPVFKPIRPSIPLNTALGAFLGLFVAIAVIVLGVVIDNTVHTQEDIEQRLHLPFLGVLPSIEQGERARSKTGSTVTNGVVPAARDLYIVKNPKSTVAECARSLRTNLLFLGARRPLRRLLVTSAGPSEGKSTTVLALGSTMALAGNRVLLVDTDFRRPRLHRTFGLKNDGGLTSVLLGEAKLEQVIKSTDVRGLDLLPCGPVPPNPSELMHTEHFLKLLDELSARYDRVLLDSPPVNVVTDAVILSQITDGTILVIKASKTTKDSARRAARQLLDINANLLGVVLNDVDLTDDGYFRSQKHYYYYKAYEYSDKDKEAEA